MAVDKEWTVVSPPAMLQQTRNDEHLFLRHRGFGHRVEGPTATCALT